MEQGEPYWNPLVPELTVADLENSLRFYLACGFSMRFRRSNPPFAYLELGKAQLMLEQQHAEGWNVEPLDRPLGRGTNFQIEVPDAEAVLSALRSLGVRPYRGVKDTWYVQATLLESGASLVGYEFASKYWRQGIGSASIDAMLTELACRTTSTPSWPCSRVRTTDPWDSCITSASSQEPPKTLGHAKPRTTKLFSSRRLDLRSRRTMWRMWPNHYLNLPQSAG